MSQTKLLWLSSAVVFVLFASLTFGWCYARAPRSLIRGSALGQGISETARLGVEVKPHEGSSLFVSRNRGATVVLSAKAGTLQVDDGSQHRKIHMDSAPLISSARPRTSKAEPAKSPAGPTQAPEFKNSGGTFSTFLPARPLKQVLPNTRISWPSSLSGSTDIEVEVRIDEEGRVTDAHVVNNASTDNGVFASAALAAAKRWIFLPAKTKGQGVPSGHIIEFHFRQQAGQQ